MSSEILRNQQCSIFFNICLQQVNSLEVTPDRSMIAAAGWFKNFPAVVLLILYIPAAICQCGFALFFLGYQHIRMYDLNSNNPNPVINYDGVSKNITSVGFHEDGRWMYTGGEDCMARIWDLRCSIANSLSCRLDEQQSKPFFLAPPSGQEICSARESFK